MPQYLTRTEAKPGVTVRTDGGFTCMKAGEEHVIETTDDGLFIRCRRGQHYLAGQLEGGEYVGLTKIA